MLGQGVEAFHCKRFAARAPSDRHRGQSGFARDFRLDRGRGNHVDQGVKAGLFIYRYQTSQVAERADFCLNVRVKTRFQAFCGHISAWVRWVFGSGRIRRRQKGLIFSGRPSAVGDYACQHHTASDGQTNL